MADAITPAIQLIDADVTGAELRADTVMIKNVNWTINPGDYWVVGGLPGTGKTDLLTTAAGLQRPGSGTHLLFGQNLQQLEEGEQLRQRLRAGFVFQNGGRLFHQQTVLENLALAVCYHQNASLEEVRERVGVILKLTELSGLERRRPSILTRNIHQRIGLARALMLDPEVLLIDNPLLGIDARQAFWWLDFLPRLSKGVAEFLHRRVTLVVSTDDFRPWRGQGTHFALVNAKKWSIIGSRADLEASQDPAVREVLAPEFQREES
jgi:ABC-type transporter Mla maintaining outer membrane lipid asymmetry ATPase subunit MlaF